VKIKILLFAFPIFFVVLFAATLIFEELRPHPRVNQLIISSSGDASFLNPILAQDVTSSDINSLIFNGLIKYNRNLDGFVGDLAESWKLNIGPEPDITFFLRRGVLWQDGKEFTANDVKFTYDKIMDPKTNTVRRSSYEWVKKAEALDPYTFRVTYKQPFSPGLESWSIGTIPEHLLRDVDINAAPFNRHPIGTGPFRFVEWLSDEKIVLEANPRYFEGKPLLDGIIYRIIPEAALNETEVLAREIDYSGIYPFEYRRMNQLPFLEAYSQPGLGYTYIGYNLNNPLFQDRRVRRALTYAINREAVVQYVLYGLGMVATGPFPNNMWYGNPHVRPIPFDPEKARQLLAEAGWHPNRNGILEKEGRPFRFTLITNNGNDTRRDVAVLIQRQLRDIGIDVNLEFYEWSVFITDYIDARHFDACLLGWSLSVDPDAYEIWHSSQIEKGFNFISYRNPEVDRLLVEGRRVYDLEKRKEIYWRIHQLIAEDQPYTFLFVPLNLSVLRKRFFLLERGQLRPIRLEKAGLLYDITKWYVPKKREGDEIRNPVSEQQIGRLRDKTKFIRSKRQAFFTQMEQ
jgi:peptide/nickel transport system substrate-binding protein